MTKQKEKPMMGAKNRARVRQLLEAAAQKDGMGFCSAADCAQLLKKSVEWTDFQWFTMGMQMGVLPR